METQADTTTNDTAAPAVTEESAAAIHEAARTGQGDESLPAGKLFTLAAALPDGVAECIATSKDIASTDLVNLEAGAQYLQSAYPDFFPTVESAAEAIRAA